MEYNYTNAGEGFAADLGAVHDVSAVSALYQYTSPVSVVMGRQSPAVLVAESGSGGGGVNGDGTRGCGVIAGCASAGCRSVGG